MKQFTFLMALFATGLLMAQTNHRVEVRSNVFDPENIFIEVGDTITWENVNGFHNVNGSLADYPDNPVEFGNGTASAPWTYQFVFDQEGFYGYRCDPHFFLDMVGTVTVLPVGSIMETVLITEIMYNPPEANMDSLEFIELYNPNPNPVDLTGWTMSDGFDLDFPAGTTIAPDDYLILCVDSAAFINTLGYTGPTLQWTDGALSNGGENVAISNADGVVISEVDYSDDPPWPGIADGDGPSLQICDISMEEDDASNWAASVSGTGVIINGFEVLANPGSLPLCQEPAPTLLLNPLFSVNEDVGTVNLFVIATNFELAPEVEFTLDASSTATIDTDFSVVNGLPQVVTGEAGALDTLFLQINVVDDMDEEDDETMVFNISTSQMGVNIPNTQIVVTIEDNDAVSMQTTIGEIDDVDADGVAVSLGQTVTVEGTVHAPNFRPGGIQTTIIDANNDGIGIFSNSDPLGYDNVTEGDLLRVTGEVTQFRGLLQITLTEVTVLSQGNPLFTPTTATELGEDTESQLVRFEGLVPSTTMDVPTSGSFNFDFENSMGETIVVRIDEDVNIDLAGIVADFVANGDLIDITGIGGQFDTSDPLTEGYQLFPRRDGDFSILSSTREPAWAADLELFPNPVGDRLEVRVPVDLREAVLYDLTGRELLRLNMQVNQTSINTGGLVPGTYQLRLLSDDGQVSRLIIKN
ncbi:MAG: lamin tail domain-containing protein [Bacteroidota bacterium]